jgi:C1A family cysteine protease
MQIKTFTGVLNALKKGPLIVTLDARNWQDYNGGVMSNCGRKMNHLALLVGRTPEHFIIRNSWGRRWGERGYIRIVIGYTCGIINEAYVAEL